MSVSSSSSLQTSCPIGLVGLVGLYCFPVGLYCFPVVLIVLIVLFVNSLVSDSLGYCLKPIMTTNDLLFWAKGYFYASCQAESCSLTS